VKLSIYSNVVCYTQTDWLEWTVIITFNPEFVIVMLKSYI